MDYLQAVSPERVRTTILLYATKSAPSSFKRKKAGPIVGVFNLYCGGDEYRRIMWAYIFKSLWPDHGSQLSSKDMRLSELFGLWRWVGYTKPGDEWVTRPTFPLECIWMLGEAFKDYTKANPGWGELMGNDLIDKLAAAASVGGVVVRIDREEDASQMRYPEFDFRNNKIVTTRPEALAPGQRIGGHKNGK